MFTLQWTADRLGPENKEVWKAAQSDVVSRRISTKCEPEPRFRLNYFAGVASDSLKSGDWNLVAVTAVQ